MPDVLLIDDDTARRTAVMATLTAAGYRVHVFGLDAYGGHEVEPAEHSGEEADAERRELTAPTAHALVRWSRALVPLTEAPEDPRTVQHWARWVAVSPGALRAWCRAGGVSPRRSLVFARLLRAVCLRHNGCNRLEDLLNVVDQRTLFGLLRFAGFRNARDFPVAIAEFLKHQTLIRNATALTEITRALAEFQLGRLPRVHAARETL